MKPFEIAKSLEGTKEIAGTKDNPKIMEMYARLGHSWVEHDEVPWCAAFVGYCLEEGGYTSTRMLNARSYLEWGNRTDLALARPGDVVVFSRGSSKWEGHVAFFVRQTPSKVFVLGGNQANAVNVRGYAKSRVLGVRTYGPPKSVAPLPSQVKDVQLKLRRLGYHEVGAADGKLGSRTKGAILAFREDNALPLEPVIDKALLGALLTAKPRGVYPERASGVPANSRIYKAGKAQAVTGGIGAIATGGAVIADAASKAGDARDTIEQTTTSLGIWEHVAPYLPFILVGLFIILMVVGFKVAGWRTEDYQDGKTPYGGEG